MPALRHEIRTWQLTQVREAVARLNQKPILALTLRLPWSALPVDGSNYLIKMVEREGTEPSTPAL